MKKQKEVKIGLLGCGQRGCEVMLGSYLKIPGVRLTAICDKYETRVKEMYDAVGDRDLVCYTDHRKMLKEADIEAVVISVEPYNNAVLVCEALEAGKHVMCDVPLCYPIEDCWRVVLAVEKSGLKFQMGEQVRYAPYIQAWRRMVQEDKLGKILFVEGQYLHGMTEDRYYLDSETGRRLPLKEAENNPKAVKGRVWYTPHPILYLPHELSPILSVLEDRVIKVTCMATRRQSYRYEWFSHSDIEIALMHTEKDTILRLATGFIVPTATPNHWYHFLGTKGRVETNRYENEPMKMWFADSYMRQPAELKWEFDPETVSAEALASGHGGLDYYPMATFIESILEDKNPPLDIYKATDTAAPAIMAAKSAEEGAKCLKVPDFRPGKTRKAGQEPKKD